jgi:hypothetical protein
MRGEDSAPKEKLNWHCMKVLSMHTHHQAILQKKLLPAAQEWCSGRKGSVGTATRQGVLSHSNSPLSVGWSSMGLMWWKVGPRKVMTCNPIENLWAILDERLESKTVQDREWNENKQSVKYGMKLICPSYTTSLTLYLTVCGELGRPKEALLKQCHEHMRGRRNVQ